MKIKIKNPVAHKGKILKMDTIHDLPNKEANALIEGDFADEHKEEPPKAPEPPKTDNPPK